MLRDEPLDHRAADAQGLDQVGDLGFSADRLQVLVQLALAAGAPEQAIPFLQAG